MLNLLMFFIGIVSIFLIARYNKSNKLFWILLLAMLSGFVGGTVAANIGNNKQDNITMVSNDSGSLIADNSILFINNDEIQEISEPVVEIVHSYPNTNDVMLPTAPSKSGFFKPRQQLDYVDTS